MFCIKISKKQIFFFKLAVFYFCDNFAKRTKREQKEMEKKRYFYKIWISDTCESLPGFCRKKIRPKPFRGF